MHLNVLLFVSLLFILSAAAAEDNVEADLKETSDEAVGDRIMEEMNGMKEKFDVALNRIDEEIRKDEKEQDELKLQAWKMLLTLQFGIKLI